MMALLVGCSSNEESIEETTFYVGQSESWLMTYSISKIEFTNYESLTLQYLCGNDGIDEVGPIEYELVTHNGTWESSYPQDLQGVASFHTSSVSNADFIQMKLEQEMDLTVKWDGKIESIKLERVN